MEKKKEKKYEKILGFKRCVCKHLVEVNIGTAVILLNTLKRNVLKPWEKAIKTRTEGRSLGVTKRSVLLQFVRLTGGDLFSGNDKTVY